MGLFTDIYNTVAKFFRQQDEQANGDASKSVATNRLKLVLMQDRTNLTPKVLEQMRGELVDLLSKYLEMDKDLLELNFEHEGDQVALMLSIPVIRAKDEEVILAAIEEVENEIEEDEEENEDEEPDTETENSVEDENSDSSEETSEKAEEEQEEAPKPKKKRSKKVTKPEEVDSNNNSDEKQESEKELVFEKEEG